MNESMKYVLSAVMAMGIGASQMTRDAPAPEHRSTTLVADWGGGTQVDEPAKQDPADELHKLAEQIKQDAEALRESAAEQRKIAEGLGTFQPKKDTASSTTCECNCDGDCLSEKQVRDIARDEVAFALRQRMNTTGSSSGGSTGGSVTSSPVNGYTSGSTAMPPTANPRMFGERLGREPLKATIHTFANGQHCPACDRWLSEVAPQLQANGVYVTQIADITNGSAPVIDACKGRDVCQRFTGYTDAATIITALQ